MSASSHCYWLTGLSGAGKSTLGQALAERLRGQGVNTVMLDGDVLRQGLSSDLGFSDADRSEQIRRSAELAKLLVNQGVTVIVSLISPTHADRAAARALFQPGQFVEVFVDAPLTACEHRDVKGLYQRARSGQLAAFTGVSSPYEAPASPEAHVRTDRMDVATCVDAILSAHSRQRALP